MRNIFELLNGYDLIFCTLCFIPPLHQGKTNLMKTAYFSIPPTDTCIDYFSPGNMHPDFIYLLSKIFISLPSLRQHKTG